MKLALRVLELLEDHRLQPVLHPASMLWRASPQEAEVATLHGSQSRLPVPSQPKHSHCIQSVDQLSAKPEGRAVEKERLHRFLVASLLNLVRG